MTDLKDDRGVLRTEVGQELSLSCDCRMSDTREASLYSIKWYKENRRVYVYSPVVDFSKVSENRVSVTFQPFPTWFKRNL